MMVRETVSALADTAVVWYLLLGLYLECSIER